MSMTDKCRLLFALAALVVLGGCNDNDSPQEVTPTAAPAPVPHVEPVSGGNLARIQAAKVLRIGVKADNPPFGFQDAEGRPQGFDVDLGFRIARVLGVQPSFVTVTSKDRIEKLKNGEIDIIIATLTATRSRSHEIDFSLPYFQDQQGLLVPAASPIQSYRDLSGKRVAAAAGSTSIDNLKVVAPDCKGIAVKSNIEGLEKLRAGEADAISGDGLSLQALRVDSADPAAFRIAGEGFSVEPYAIGLPRNDSEFRVRIDEALTELWTSGVWTRLFDKWLGPKTKYNFETHFQMPILPP
jgi:polar amino acid transport system substrate-binding protein